LSKKQIYYAQAERMYVIEQHNLERIASDLGVNIKTIFFWKQEGNWDEKRFEFIKGKQMFHEELYNFARKLMHSIEEDIDNSRKTDNGKLYTFTRMLPLITKIKEYEDVAAKKEQQELKDRDKTTLTPEDVREIEDLLGIRRNRKPLIQPEEAIELEEEI
jgi:uncharacterized protein YjcR